MSISILTKETISEIIIATIVVLILTFDTIFVRVCKYHSRYCRRGSQRIHHSHRDSDQIQYPVAQSSVLVQERHEARQ